MNIFITGIAGFLGSHIADALIKEGHNVSGCDNLIEGGPKKFRYYFDIEILNEKTPKTWTKKLI